MARRRVEQRDLRSLDRPGLRSIFTPLDPAEPPARGQTRDYRTMQMFTSAFTRDDPSWKDGLGLLFLPILVALISLLLWTGLPQLFDWLAVLAYLVAFTAAALYLYRKP